LSDVYLYYNVMINSSLPVPRRAIKVITNVKFTIKLKADVGNTFRLRTIDLLENYIRFIRQLVIS